MHPSAPNARNAPNASGRWTALLVVGLASACGCGSAGSGQQGFLDAPLLTVSSASGALKVAVFTNPQPPVRGNVAIRYRITDSAAEPVDGLVLEVVPWMPAMSHSTSAEPAVSAAGSGVYDLSNVFLFMAGQWQLRTTITGGMSDSAAPNFMVQ